AEKVKDELVPNPYGERLLSSVSNALDVGRAERSAPARRAAAPGQRNYFWSRSGSKQGSLDTGEHRSHSPWIIRIQEGKHPGGYVDGKGHRRNRCGCDQRE